MFKIDQVAFACNTRKQFEEAKASYRAIGDSRFTARDRVTARGVNAAGEPVANVAELAFSYTVLPGEMEFELLHYVDGWNWLSGNKRHRDDEDGGGFWTVNLGNAPPAPFASHFGMHVKTESEINCFRDQYRVLQEVVTVHHTNPEIAKSRRYHYVILDARARLGADLKLIRRLTLKEAEELLNG